MKSKNLHVGIRETAPTRWRAWVPALLWAGAIFVLSSFPGSAYPATTIVHADKAVHCVLYGTLAALCARGLARSRPSSLLAVWLAAAALATVYGMTDEFHQRFVPGRNSDWADVLADAVGAGLGAGATVLLLRRQRRPRSD
jgi:VanZ family protein